MLFKGLDVGNVMDVVQIAISFTFVCVVMFFAVSVMGGGLMQEVVVGHGLKQEAYSLKERYDLSSAVRANSLYVENDLNDGTKAQLNREVLRTFLEYYECPAV